MSRSIDQQVRARGADFWAPPDLRDQVATVLAAAGKNSANTTVEELADFDQFHVLGPDATRRLAGSAGVGSGQHVLDVGSGLGGPARMLAKEFGCRVTGIDLTPAYLETAELLSAVTGMSEQVMFQQGDATDLEFEADTFDVVWTQHIAQSVPEKDLFFSEMARVMKPDGTLVLHDLYKKSVRSCTYPAVWGDDESTTFLIPAEKMRSLVESNGLQVESWVDTTQETREWTNFIVQMLSAPDDSELVHDGIPGLDYSLFFGVAKLQRMMTNAVEDMDSGTIGFFEAVAHKPA